MSSTKGWRLFVDGAARNNPGPAGAGVCLIYDQEIRYSHGFFLGIKTNNQAEYLALLIGLVISLPKINQAPLHIISDSQLLIHQINGVYKVRDPQLKILHACTKSILAEVKYKATHVLRRQNQLADQMANLGIEEQIAVPKEIKQILKQHAVEL